MMDRIEDYDSNIINKEESWVQDKIFDIIWNDKIDDFFESYEQFDKYWFLTTKNKDSLIYSGNVLLDWEVSWKLYSDFYETFINSIKWIIGENLFNRISVFFEEKDYILSNQQKKYDSDPFLDDKFQVILLEDQTIAQIIERRNSFNNVEFHYIVYPNRIFSFLNKLCKKHDIKI